MDWSAASVQIRTGSTSGQTPFDDLFALGLDRDDDHRLRAHPATHDGKKGAAVIERSYVLLNTEVEKKVHDFMLVRFAIAPFLDIAKGQRTYVDAGLDFRIRIASLARVSFSVARDLRSGKTVWFGASH
jgi:hypothetical protein